MLTIWVWLPQTSLISDWNTSWYTNFHGNPLITFLLTRKRPHRHQLSRGWQILAAKGRAYIIMWCWQNKSALASVSQNRGNVSSLASNCHIPRTNCGGKIYIINTHVYIYNVLVSRYPLAHLRLMKRCIKNTRACCVQILINGHINRKMQSNCISEAM